MNASTVIRLLTILLTIHGVITLRGESNHDVRFSEYVVSIWYFDEHRCTGAILDKTHILTVGHCVNNLPSSLLSIIAGISSYAENIQKIPVKEIHVHPEFGAVGGSNDLHWKNDIAILEISEELQWGSAVAAVSLTDTEYNWNPCNVCGMFGWDDGTQLFHGIKLLTLRWSQIMILEDEECRRQGVYLSNNTKCSINRFGTTVLENGDYGGPVICDRNTVGMVINGGQNVNSPRVLLSIYPYLRFIAEILHVGEINIPYGNFEHYVAILYRGSYMCGGSIIDSTHVLTAAHCVTECTRDTLVVIPGQRRINLGNVSPLQALVIFATQLLVDRIQIHPEFRHSSKGTGRWKFVKNDIAVLTLHTRFTWSADIQPIQLSPTLPFGKECQVYRWSRTVTSDGETLLKSMWSSARILDPYTCRRINPFLDPNRFCVVNSYALPIANMGDSGSPIICDGVLVGILSTHTLSMRLDSPNQAIFFTAVFPYFGFLNLAVIFS